MLMTRDNFWTLHKTKVSTNLQTTRSPPVEKNVPLLDTGLVLGVLTVRAVGDHDTANLEEQD